MVRPEANGQLLYYGSDKVVAFFDNNAPSGRLLRGHNETTQKYADELATRIEDAFVLNLFAEAS